MKRMLFVMAAGLAVVGCGQEAEAPKAAAAPASLPAGEYELTATVKTMASTDGTPVPTFAKVGDVITTRGCVGADGLPAPELLATKGDSCTIANPYVKNGRMDLTLNCDRKGQGKVMANVNGKFTAEGFTGTLSASSSFVGTGDFRLVQDLSARKVADQCAAPAAGGAEKKG